MSLKMIVADRRFWPLFWTQFLGALNDNVFKNALVVMVTFQNATVWGLHKAQVVALAGGLFILPFFLFSPLAGQISDKWEKSRLVRLTKYWEVLIMAVAGVGFVFHQFELLLIVLFLAGVQASFFGPVKYSAIPELVRPAELVSANAYVELGTFLAILLGTILGAKLVSLQSGELVIGTALLALAVMGVWTSRQMPRVVPGSVDLKIQYNPLPSFRFLFLMLRRSIALYNSALGISWFWFFGAAVLSILPVFCADYLRVDETVLTVFLAMFTLGIGFGSLACEKLSFGQVELGLVPIGSLGMTIFLLDICWTGRGMQSDTLQSLSLFLQQPGGLRLMIDFFIMSMFGGFFILPLYTLLQERSAVQERSRVIAANNIMNAVFMVVASLSVMAFHAAHLSYIQMFAVLALLNLVMAFYIYSIVPEFTLRFWAWLVARGLYRIRAQGLANVPSNGPAFLVCNHVSFIDWMIIMACVRRPVRFVMYYRFFNIPLVRYLMKQAKVIPICGAKEDPQMLARAFEQISRALRASELVCIFPEGKLTRDGKMDGFRPGIEKALAVDPVPVVPMALRGLWPTFFTYGGGLLNKTLPRHWLKRVQLSIGGPVAAEHARAAYLEERVRDLLVSG